MLAHQYLHLNSNIAVDTGCFKRYTTMSDITSATWLLTSDYIPSSAWDCIIQYAIIAYTVQTGVSR